MERVTGGAYNVAAALRTMLHPCFHCILSVLFCAVLSGRASAGSNHGPVKYEARDMEYGIVVDAGSSGSRVRVYEWHRQDSSVGVTRAREVFNHQVRPGVSTLADRLSEVPEYVTGLVNAAKDGVPEIHRPQAAIFFLATAGMRLLLEDRANDVIEAVDSVLSDPARNPFRYSTANTRILSGEEEGAFAWIALNSLRGFFDKEGAESVGVLELGGASTQIAFIPSGSLLANKFPVKIGSTEYSLYVHSYLYYGNNYAQQWAMEYLARQTLKDTAIPHPCVLQGDSKNRTVADGRHILYYGTGNAEKCQEIIDAYVYDVDPHRCHPKPCAIGPIYQPTIEFDHDFYAISSFIYPLKAFGIIQEDGTVIPQDIKQAAREYCHMSFSEAQESSGEKPEYVSGNCLIGLYAETLFTKGYGFSEQATNIKAVNKINGERITWALGAILYETGKRTGPCEGASVALGAAPSSAQYTHLFTYIISSLSCICYIYFINVMYE